MACKIFTLLLAMLVYAHEAACRPVGEIDPNEDTSGFYNWEMGKDRSVKTFYYKGGDLSIYEGRNATLTRYYVTPLTELISESARCIEPGTHTKYIVRFRMVMWSSDVANEAVRALASPPLNLAVQKEHVHPLPIMKMRLSTHSLSHAYEPETEWQTNIHSRHQRNFIIYAANKEACERMVTEIKEEPDLFASKIKVEVAMSAEKRASRIISITGENIGRSEMFSQLDSMDRRNGEPLLTSSDLNNLAQEIVSSVIASEITTGAYVERGEGVNFARLLERQLSRETTNAQQLTADQWKSVFWREEFTRPDRYSRYLNRAVTYDQGTEQFAFNNETENEASKHTIDEIKKDTSASSDTSTKVGGSYGVVSVNAEASHSQSNSESNFNKNEEDASSRNVAKLSKDQLQSFLRQKDIQVEWNGEQFVPKSLALHRVNTAQLKHTSTIATQQVQVQTVPITVKLDATVPFYDEPDSRVTDHVRILIDQTKKELEDKIHRTNNQLSRMQNELDGKITDHANKIELIRSSFNRTDNFEILSLPQINPYGMHIGRQIVIYPYGMHIGRQIVIYGTPSATANRFCIDLSGPPGSIALHMSVHFDENVIVRNSLRANKWEHEERHGGVFPFQRNQPFQMQILCDHVGYKIAINGQHFTDFVHRIEASTVYSVMTAGDLSAVNVQIF